MNAHWFTRPGARNVALAFGVGGPGGLVNTTFKSAIPHRNFTDVMVKYGRGNERRSSIDLKRSLLDATLALRVNGVYQEMGGWKDFAQNDTSGGAFGLTYLPLENTKRKLNAEAGSMLQNRVRSWNLADQNSVWETQGDYFFPFGTAESPWLPDDPLYSRICSGGASSSDNGLSADISAGQAFERRTAHLGNPTIFVGPGSLVGRRIQFGERNQGARYYRTSFNDNLPGFDS